jgi:hypothetical protein
MAAVAEAPILLQQTRNYRSLPLFAFFITNSQQTKISCWFVSDAEKNKAGHHQGHATIK